MRTPTHDERGAVGFNMTPMIDIVFLLIIFFLVSSHLAKQEVQLDLDLPPATTGVTPNAHDSKWLVINVLPEGHVLLGGQRVTHDELRERLSFQRQEEGGDVEVRIRTDRLVPYRFVEPVMVACARSGLWNVTFAVLDKQSSRSP